MIIVQLKILSYHIYHFEFPSCLLVLVISSCLLFCPSDMTSEFNLWEWVLNTSVIFVTSYRPPTLDEEVLRWGGVCCHADSRGSQWMEVNLQVLPSYHIILFPVGVFLKKKKKKEYVSIKIYYTMLTNISKASKLQMLLRISQNNFLAGDVFCYSFRQIGGTIFPLLHVLTNVSCTHLQASLF